MASTTTSTDQQAPSGQRVDVRRRRLIILLGGLVGLVAVVLSAIVVRGPRIEDDLTQKSQAALAEAGIEVESVTFDGRDATLAGTLGSNSEFSSAVAVVAAIPGVRDVNSQLQTAPPEPAPPTTTPPATTQPPATATGLDPPSFVLLVSGGTAALSGTVPDPDIKDAIFGGAAEAFGTTNVVNRISLSESVGTTEWLENLPYLLAELGDVSEFSLVITGGTAELSGLAVSSAASSSIETLMKASLPGLTVVNRLEVGVDEREVVQRKIDSLDLSSITFDTGSTELRSGSFSVLGEVVAILQAHPDVSIEVEGHTDATGSESQNLEISQGRAEAVVDHLVSDGVAQSRLSAVGYGSSRPVGDNFTEEGRAENRRIEFTVSP